MVRFYVGCLLFKAAQEACSQMGTRKFYDMMISDALQEQMRGGKVVHPDHVFSLRDYMQVNNFILFLIYYFLILFFKIY